MKTVFIIGVFFMFGKATLFVKRGWNLVVDKIVSTETINVVFNNAGYGLMSRLKIIQTNCM
jgi:hypothetical protein